MDLVEWYAKRLAEALEDRASEHEALARGSGHLNSFVTLSHSVTREAIAKELREVARLIRIDELKGAERE